MATMKRMKAYESFNVFVADQKRPQRAVIRALRRFVKRVRPELVESVKWGNGCWLDGEKPVAFAYAASDHVQFGFFGGAKLKDPRKLLQGSGQYVRHIKVSSPSKIDARAFAALLRQAKPAR